MHHYACRTARGNIDSSLHNFRVILRGALNPRTRDFTLERSISNVGKDATRNAKASVTPVVEIVFIMCYVVIT